MKVIKEFFGNNGKIKNVLLYTLTNNNGMQVKISSFGACVTSIKVNDKNGIPEDVVLGFDTLEQYEGPHPFFGVICGRYANRIGNAAFTLDGITYTLAKNNGENMLHGGNVGFDKVIWNSESIENANEIGVKLTYNSPHMEEGFPGNMKVEVQYLLNNLNELKILYSATSDKKTVVNLTNHCYFNLNGMKKEIYDHVLSLNADLTTAIDEGLIPTGILTPVKNTPLDFSKPTRIGDNIDKVKGGYDHNYVLNKKSENEFSFAGKVIDPNSGRTMEVYTTEPGIQLYSANWLDGSKGRNDVSYKKHYAFCLETQHYPDSPNHPEFPSTILNPGETYSQKTVYKFGII
jgi:aldose 1-epimerase